MMGQNLWGIKLKTTSTKIIEYSVNFKKISKYVDHNCQKVRENVDKIAQIHGGVSN